MNLRRVEVEWVDSAGASGWEKLNRAKEQAERDSLTCYSCGYLVESNRRYLLIALSRTDHGDDGGQSVGETLQIPRVAVRTVKELRR